MNTKKPLFKAAWTLKGKRVEGIAHTSEALAESQGRDALAKGAKHVLLLRDSQGADHSDNAGKFFLHRFIR